MADGGTERGAAKSAHDGVLAEHRVRETAKKLTYSAFFDIIGAMKEQKQETRTTETITISRVEYDMLMELKVQNKWLMEQLRLLRKKRFSASSEQTKEHLDGQLSLLLMRQRFILPHLGRRESPKIAAHNQKKSGSVKDVVPDSIVEVVEHRLSEEERVYLQCGELMREIGTAIRET